MIKKPSFRFRQSLFLMITLFCLLAALLQGIPVLYAIPAAAKRTAFTAVFVLSLLILFYLLRRGRLSEEGIVFAILFFGMLMHCSYVVLSGLYERQHDEGYYTGIADRLANPGHIGYSEYIYKFRRLPDMDPYQLFSYYHPPLHYVIAGLWLILLTTLGMPEDLAFENLQILPLFYSGLFMFLIYLILKKLNAKGKSLYAGLTAAALHPALTIMSGSVNNDMLSSVLLLCTILFTLCWIREKSLKKLIPLALSIGFGMLCKINTAIIVFPVGLLFLFHFIAVLRTRNKSLRTKVRSTHSRGQSLWQHSFCSARAAAHPCPQGFYIMGNDGGISYDIKKEIRNFFIFGCIAAFIGLSWITRNFILFHEKPGISSATESSVMYTGDYSLWARIGLPAFADWHFSFPFHPLSGDVIHNIWVIMFQTSLFAEVFPAELSGLPLFLCRTAYLGAIFSGTASGILFLINQFRKLKRETHPCGENAFTALFLSAGYLLFILSFVVFSIKYPYTCSSDFRYIIVCLLYTAVGLSDNGSESRQSPAALRIFSRVTRVSVCATVLLTAIIYMTWKQW